MNIVTGILLALQYAPYVVQAVIAIEQTIRGVPGSVKRQIVLDAIQAGAAGTDEPKPAGLNEHIVGTMIDNVVATLNQSGVFQKGPQPPTPHVQ